MPQLVLKDTTFRDGVQGKGAEATVLSEALEAIKAIDALGIRFHEVGFIGANDAVDQRIRAACQLDLSGQICAFGRTHQTDVSKLIAMQQEVGLPVGVLVGKSRTRDAEKALGIGPEQNLGLITESVSALKAAGLQVIYDAEHFFDGFYNDDRQYALLTITTALSAGADWIVLCDTNGAMTPAAVANTIRLVKLQNVPVERLGIHTHNDRGRAVANAEAALAGGVCLFEGTIGGVGERVGNMDLCTFIPNAVLDYGATGVSPEQLVCLRQTWVLVCDVLNVTPRGNTPFVGSDAFRTEAGMHASGEVRDPGGYLHCDPSRVGNQARFDVTDQSGWSNLAIKAKEFGLVITTDQVKQIARAHQQLVDSGWNFGSADASLYLFFLGQLDRLPVLLEVQQRRIIDEWISGQQKQSEATMRLIVKGRFEYGGKDGRGPVNALDNALRDILCRQYPELVVVELTDFKVRTVDSRGTASRVRVLIQFSDGSKTWRTTAVHEDIIEASWKALLDGYLFKLVANGHLEETSAASAFEPASSATSPS